MKKFLFLCLFFILSFVFSPFIYSDELDDLNKEISDLTNSLNQSINATKPLESELTALRKQINDIKGRIGFLDEDIKAKKANIEKGYKNLEKQEEILGRAIRDYYIKSYYNSPLVVFFSSSSASEITHLLAYQKAATNQDKVIITNIALSIMDLETKKKDLEQEQIKLNGLKASLDEQEGKLDKVVAGAKTYQASLSNKIAELSAKQQQILAQKLGSLNLPSSLGAGPLYCTDDRKLDPGFSPAFAFYTFGIPHRIGMNQYGADGRAKAGQSHEDILRAYFDNISFESKSSRIRVEGFGEMDLEEYMLGIYEMPNSFHIEALKAQAVAARSYALSYTNNGEKEICTTQACQVYKGGNKGGAWEQAVRDTTGKVMSQNGQVITAWYASTAGGYTFYNDDVWGGGRKGWTKRMKDGSADFNSFESIISSSYDKESPCLYSAQGFRTEYSKSAWLKPDEVADIANVILLARADSSVKEHLYQPDKPNPAGTETWDQNRVRQELRSRSITPFESVSDISINADFGTGITNTISLSGSGKTESFSGSEFKNWFNLRAPANIQIVGPLYNVERR